MANPIDAFIVEALRTPIGRGRAGGALHDVHPVDLLALTLSKLTDRAGIPKAAVEDVIAGCVTPIADQGWNVVANHLGDDRAARWVLCDGFEDVLLQPRLLQPRLADVGAQYAWPAAPSWSPTGPSAAEAFR